MAIFNLSKVTINEKMLEDDRVELHNKKPNVSIQKQLLDNHKEEADVTSEKQLYKARLRDNTSTTIEARLDTHDPAEGLPKRTGNDEFSQMPMDLLDEKAHQQKIKDYAAAGYMEPNEETKFWDEYITSSDIKPAKSQLHNSVDRFDGLTDGNIMKNKGVREMVFASLSNADAMLYHIYREASGRPLTERETIIVDGINQDKTALISKLLQKNV